MPVHELFHELDALELGILPPSRVDVCHMKTQARPQRPLPSSGRRGRSQSSLPAWPRPVASGLVPRLDRPGGNVTGFANYEASLGGKRLELLSEIAPGLKRAAISGIEFYACI